MPTYRQAQFSKALRQPYLDDFFQQYPSPDVSGLHYVESHEEVRHAMESLFPIQPGNAGKLPEIAECTIIVRDYSLFGKGLALPLFVTPLGFIADEAALGAIIRFHEYTHARDIRIGMDFKDVRVDDKSVDEIRPAVLDNILETRAYEAVLPCKLNSMSSLEWTAAERFASYYNALAATGSGVVRLLSGGGRAFENRIIHLQLKQSSGTYQRILAEAGLFSPVEMLKYHLDALKYFRENP